MQHLAGGLLALTLGACASVGSPFPAEKEPPSLLFPGLFEEVAMADIVPAKDWSDAEPLAEPKEILAAYDEEAPRTDQELMAFVSTWFELPGEIDPAALPPSEEPRSLSEHIDALWPLLTRPAVEADPYTSLLSLPNRYVVPGGRFREVYYWDSYFTMLGLDGDEVPLRRSMVENFAHQIETYGHVPNGNRSYYLSRSQPPFFFMMVSLLNEEEPEAAWSEFLPALRAEHRFWTAGEDAVQPASASGRIVRLSDGTVLSRYYDDREAPRDESYMVDVEAAERAAGSEAVTYRHLRAAAESGWDFSSRWLDVADDLATIRTTQIVPVDLNSLLYGLERAISEGCAYDGDEACADEFAERAAARAQAINAVFWSEELGAYTDYDMEAGRPTTRLTAATLYPLFFGAADQDLAERTAETVRERLLAPRGLLTSDTRSGQQWDAPNGWAPLHWLAVEGLADVDPALSEAIAERWTRTVALTYCESGRLVEKYDVTEALEAGGGEYPNQDGFGWTNGVTAALIERLPSLSHFGEVRPGDALCSGETDQAIASGEHVPVARRKR